MLQMITPLICSTTLLRSLKQTKVKIQSLKNLTLLLLVKAFVCSHRKTHESSISTTDINNCNVKQAEHSSRANISERKWLQKFKINKLI